ncbi:hypothetical protein MKZ38_004655 [Zalerion maritima]|uniref:Uncharacterized protein n=1 Tax=Zalerion maritima TaxID=339359 RepID=A0AAD5WPS0_9PEZI|nr:hypothetical protein MKZ38_004655 [Zalerion maritima]
MDSAQLHNFPPPSRNPFQRSKPSCYFALPSSRLAPGAAVGGLCSIKSGFKTEDGGRGFPSAPVDERLPGTAGDGGRGAVPFRAVQAGGSLAPALEPTPMRPSDVAEAAQLGRDFAS